jgi:hypothetical protein
LMSFTGGAAARYARPPARRYVLAELALEEAP